VGCVYREIDASWDTRKRLYVLSGGGCIRGDQHQLGRGE